MLPVLDLNIWLDETDKSTPIKHMFYQKKVSNKSLVLAESAMPFNMKRATLVEEGLRRMKNCSPCLSWPNISNIMTEFNWCMMISGHKEKFRKDITLKVMDKYDKLLENDKLNVSPFYRTKKERMIQNKSRKLEKSKSGWFNKKGFSGVLRVDPTPGGVLAKRVKKRLARENMPNKVGYNWFCCDLGCRILFTLYVIRGIN